jgi:hypothetical protein
MLNDGLADKMSVVEFAKCARLDGIRDCGKTVLFDAFREGGQSKPLPRDIAQKLWDLWREISEMAKSFEPFKLDLSNGAAVHEWLVARRDDDVFVAVVRLNDNKKLA